jgi:hypothetical protein
MTVPTMRTRFNPRDEIDVAAYLVDEAVGRPVDKTVVDSTLVNVSGQCSESVGHVTGDLKNSVMSLVAGQVGGNVSGFIRDRHYLNDVTRPRPIMMWAKDVEVFSIHHRGNILPIKIPHPDVTDEESR